MLKRQLYIYIYILEGSKMKNLDLTKGMTNIYIYSLTTPGEGYHKKYIQNILKLQVT